MADFNDLLIEHIPRLRRYARSLVRDAAQADDHVQECLTRALAKSHLFQPGTDLRAWLFTMLHHQHVNWVRRSIGQGTAVDVEDCERLFSVPGGQSKQHELRDLERAMGMLSEEQRTVVLLVGMEGMSYEQVAEIIGVPVGTVRSRLSRGREMLRTLMGASAAEEAGNGKVPRPTIPFSFTAYASDRWQPASSGSRPPA